MPTANPAAATVQLPMGDTGNVLQPGLILSFTQAERTLTCRLKEALKVSGVYIISITQEMTPCTCLHGAPKARGKTLMSSQDYPGCTFPFPLIPGYRNLCYQAIALAGPWRLGHLPHWISIATEFPPHDPVPMEGGEGREREREAC